MKRNVILKKKYLIFIAALSVGLGLLAACGGKGSVEAAQRGAPAAAPVVVADVQQRDVPVELSAIGNVEAYQTVQIKSQVDGQIKSIFFTEGQDVHKGQLLVQLDKAPFQANLEKAIGQLKKDQAQAENSKLQAERYTQLEKDGVISREQADLQRTQAKADASAVYADQAAVDAARVQLQYTDISAPISGRTGALLINKGNLVKANDTPFLVQLNEISPIYVTFTVPESDLDKVRQYQAHKELTVSAYPKGSNNAAQGRLTFIDNGVDTTTGTVKLKATFANKDKRLWPGEFVNAVLQLSMQKNAILVPTKAIQSGQEGDYVYVVTPQNVAEARTVKTSGTYQDYTLVASGLQKGERVVVDGQLRVAPHAKVTVQNRAANNSGGSQAAAMSAGGSQ